MLERDPRADGQFVYAVKSTHIYCRPTCASRRPDRKNVTFFPSPAAARAAGYRACLRCEPDLAAPRPDPQAAALAQVTEYLTEHAHERTRLKDVARATGVPRLTILRGFKRVLGLTPTQFAKSQRLDRFREELRPSSTPARPPSRNPARNPGAPVTDAIYEAGFGSSSRLYENSAATLGMTPTALRRGGPGITVRYTLADSPLGRILVAATEIGVCAIAFADDDAALRAELSARFPKAALVEEQLSAGTWLAGAVDYVLAELSENPVAASFPLDVRATAFQGRVWQALAKIPRGETRTYSEIARELDRPTAARAVAAACSANPLALLQPCHRVLGANGSLTGYRWGIDRKRQILDRELRASRQPGT